MALTRYPGLSHFVTAAWRGRELRALAYAGQRKAFGIPLGEVYLGSADYGDSGVIADEQDRGPVVRLAISNLLRYPAVHTIIVRDQPLDVEFPAQPGLSARIELQEVRSILPLAQSFETFLQSLGRHTRRNLIYYRRKAFAQGCDWVEQLSARQVDIAIETLLRRQRTSCHSRPAIEARCEILKRKPRSFWSGLRTATGEWLALSGVWQEGDRAFMLFQLNHDAEAYRRASLSTVLRSCLIESLIAREARELIFLGGCKGILEPFCRPVQSRVVTIEKRGPAPTFRRALLAGALRVRRETGSLRASFPWTAGNRPGAC